MRRWMNSSWLSSVPQAAIGREADQVSAPSILPLTHIDPPLLPRASPPGRAPL